MISNANKKLKCGYNAMKWIKEYRIVWLINKKPSRIQ